MEWIWRHYLAEGAITSLAGDPGQGKSTVSRDLIARLTSGRGMPVTGGLRRRAGAVLLQGEDGVDTVVRPALAAAGADLTRVVVYDPREFTSSPFILPADVNLVEDAVLEVRAKLLVIDPAQAFFACNPNSERAVRKALRPLTQLAEKRHLAVLLVHHLNKCNAANPMYQAGGSIAWTAAARAAFQVVKDRTDNDPHLHLLCQVKNNLASAATLRYRTRSADDQVAVEWEGVSGFTLTDLQRGAYEDGSKLWEAMEILYLILRDGAKWSKLVVEKAQQEQVAKRTLERAKAAMRVQSEPKKESWDWHWYWQLPTDENPVVTYLRNKYEAQEAAARAVTPPAQ
jgi:hypothetical protein